ncbi:phage portal family protein [Pseudotamlana agarivorans]|uniref:phage portal protein n=1 Tax=Pseudotamlana agarivorans TaxID=481183 RepID=UPI0008311EFA|nr:phage portal protein [Tamlana agarivorans]
MKLYNEIKHNILSVKLDKRNDIYTAGNDNLFPQLIETLINISVTSKTCVDKVAKAIYGKSFGELGKITINKDGQTLNEVLRIASREYAKHNNLYIAVSYNLLFEITSIKVIPFTQVRIGKQDDLGYSGKYIIADWENKPKAESFKIYNRFNSNKTVIESQIENAGGIRNYKGQILHIQKDSNAIYSLTDLNPVLNEALLENNSQIFRSNGAEKGFQNTKLVVVQPFSNDDDRRAFRNKLKELQGAENSGNILLLESSNMSDDLDKQIKLEDLTSAYDDELFKYSDEQAEKNICKAFGVPLMLVNPSDNGMFGNSGEMLKEAKKQLFESKEEERDMIEEVFQNLMGKFTKPIEADLKIINPFEQITSDNIPTENE